MTLKVNEFGVELGFADIPDLLGQTIQSPFITISDQQRQQFGEATMIDQFALPQDADIYPEGLLEGFHLLGLLDYFVNLCVDMDRAEVYGLNYGLDRVRFVSPMQVGRPLRFRCTVSKVEPKGAGYLITFDCTLEHEDADRPGVAAVWICYQLPIAASAPSPTPGGDR